MDTEKDNESSSSREQSGPRKVILRPRRVDYPRRDREHREEYAAEVNPVPMQVRDAPRIVEERKDSEAEYSGSRVMGYVGLGMGIASLFIWSFILGPIAAVVGYYSYVKEQKTLGAWAMGLGIVATLSYFVMIPFAR
ncbi:hypothetical protein [Paenibacillus odorifer]|jgi:hypothetical protein|uniref:hypothetical protein n=1 Tax=Paenibacillus TaxID=44249 RepID=UPI0004F7D987|nr:hypothetical protein [Paenibacillus odorifer]AIQ75973.1 hypothetical protein PODO_23500 [Paenibacillus odorifer]OMC72898.1 hypothetical protein BK121_08220 [Paenibacillus odorifer]OMC96334.1 hypothetical protein BJP49_11630 [Paenibacillus odorifer]OMD04307.1 hypothetical protein BJP46_13055 [Paenibacillus odorifer]OMD57261.1 hypothetical protein BSK55_18145 [Paenibacillus odorifer]